MLPSSPLRLTVSLETIFPNIIKSYSSQTTLLNCWSLMYKKTASGWSLFCHWLGGHTLNSTYKDCGRRLILNISYSDGNLKQMWRMEFSETLRLILATNRTQTISMTPNLEHGSCLFGFYHFSIKLKRQN